MRLIAQTPFSKFEAFPSFSKTKKKPDPIDVRQRKSSKSLKSSNCLWL